MRCPKERGRAILGTPTAIRTAFDKDAHHLHVRVQSSTHERGVPRFIAPLHCSLLEQLLHLRSVAVTDGVEERFVEAVLVGPISSRSVLQTGGRRCRESPNGDEHENKNEEEDDTESEMKNDLFLRRWHYIDTRLSQHDIS